MPYLKPSYNKQIFSMSIGVLLVFCHIIFSIYAWFILEIDTQNSLSVKEITTPLSVAYFIGIVQYFIYNQGIVTSKVLIGIPYILIILLIILVMITSLPVGIYLFKNNPSFDDMAVNNFYMFVEMFFGAGFSLVMTDLFGTKVDKSVDKR